MAALKRQPIRGGFTSARGRAFPQRKHGGRRESRVALWGFGAIWRRPVFNLINGPINVIIYCSFGTDYYTITALWT